MQDRVGEYRLEGDNELWGNIGKLGCEQYQVRSEEQNVALRVILG